MRDPLAFFLTVRTYGTWLHGDDRGSVDDDHNQYGTPLLDPNADRLNRAARVMRFPHIVFDDHIRRVVDDSLVDTCRFRNWMLVERAVQTNHIHIVVGFSGLAPERMLQRIKARATRVLRESRLLSLEHPVWVDGPGSRRYLWTQADVADAAAYVRDYQDSPR